MVEIVKQQGQTATSPFEALKRVEGGHEFWSALDLQALMGYARWRNFQGALDRMSKSLQNSGEDSADHMAQARHMIRTGKGAKREVVDYRLSRLAAYLLAMNGDPENPEVAQAQLYFAQQTRRAELNQAQAQAQALESAGRHELVMDAKFELLNKMAVQVVTAACVGQAYGGGKVKALYQLGVKNIHPLGYFTSVGKEVEVFPMLDVFQQFNAGMGPLAGRALLACEWAWTPYPAVKQFQFAD